MASESDPTQPRIVRAAAPEQHLRPLSHADRVRLFGAFDFTPDPVPPDPARGTLGEPERVAIAGRWVADNILRVDTPQLAHLGRRTLRMHRLAAEPLQAMLAAWESAGLLKHVLTVNGAFYPRYKRGKTGPNATHADLSTHSWGCALDICAPWNRLGKPPAPLGTRGSVVELVPIAEQHGFAWGGYWTRPDGMHFELARVNAT